MLSLKKKLKTCLINVSTNACSLINTYIRLKTITDGDGRTDYSFIIYINL